MDSQRRLGGGAVRPTSLTVHKSTTHLDRGRVVRCRAARHRVQLAIVDVSGVAGFLVHCYCLLQPSLRATRVAGVQHWHAEVGDQGTADDLQCSRGR